MDKVKKSSVLIVDDDAPTLMMLTEILSPEYTVYAAKTGQGAIEAAENYLPDVILLDIIMPEMDGYEALSALKNSERTQNIPVIIITSLSDVDEEVKGLLLGAADYITKPFSFEVVKLRVGSQIKMLRQARQIFEKELAEKNHLSKIEFLMRMSHEMLTPMNVIIGMTQVVKMSNAPRGVKEYIDEIDTASRRLQALISDLLYMAGKKDGALRLDSAVFSFNTMLQRVLKNIEPEMRKKRQTFAYDIAPSVPALLRGDEERLAHVIINLLTNAIKFTPDFGKVHLSTHMLDEDDEAITLQNEITDNGIGIAKEQQGGIFDMFVQVDEGVKRTQSGAGLGLTIAKQIIELMDGKIWVESDLEKGSKFIFTCKLKKV